MATYVNGLSPTKDSRLLIDASEQPLRRSPGTPDGEEWPTLQPTPGISPIMSPTATEDWIRLSANYEFPIQNTPPVASADRKSFEPLVTDDVQERSTPTPLRSSDSANSTDYGNESDRAHSPPPMSFSQPRVKPFIDSSTPRTPSYTRSSHHATASRIPIYEPKKTPNIVDIKPRSTLENPRPARTLGERLLGPQADLAAVDNLRNPRQLSSRTPRKGSSESGLLTNKMSLANMRQSARKVPFSKQEAGSENHVPLSDASSERSSVRVNHISGQLLSTSFPGSTLTISDEADRVIYGTPEKEKGDQSRINAGTPLEFSVSVTSPDGSTPVRKTMQTNVGDILSADHGNDVLPGATITAQDEHTHQQIAATLSFLEGTPPAEMTPTQDAFLDFATEYGRRPPQMSHGIHPAAARSSGTLTSDLRKTVATLPRYTATDAPRSVQVASDRVPSYMSPTPASEARRVSNIARLNPSSLRTRPTGLSTRAPSKASILTAADENIPALPTLTVGERTPTDNGNMKRGDSGHINLAQYPDNFSMIPSEPAGAHTVPRVEITTPCVTRAIPRTRSRSKSRGMIDNIKGFFTSKQNIPPVPAQAGHASLVSHTGSPTLKRESQKPTTGSAPFSQDINGRQSESADSPCGQSTALTRMTLALMEEVNNEGDSSKKARMLSLAQVMLDAVSNAREAERSMVSAQQAAEAARMSYEMTERSVIEMARLISSSRNMPGLLKKLAAKTAAN